MTTFKPAGFRGSQMKPPRIQECSVCGRSIRKMKGIWKHENDGDPEVEGKGPGENETHWATP